MHADALADHQPPPLVGREREQATLRTALSAALAGQGSLVLIGGEAGIGKTALAEALCREATAQGVLVLIGRCYDLAETPPYGPWAAAFARAPRDSALPSLPAALAGDDANDALDSQSALFRQVGAYLAALAARTPVALLLDDLHWADQPSLDLLLALARGVGEAPILLLTTYRADEVTRRHPLHALLPALVREARAVRVAPRPLGTGDLHALVRLAHPLPVADEDRLVAHVNTRAEGNPFYAGEVLRALAEAGTLHPAGNGAGWVLGDLAAAGLPTLLRQVIDGRVDRLGEATRDLLAVAAIVGQEVPLDLWAAVAGVGDDALNVAAAVALDARLLVEMTDGSGVRFAHALIREALYVGTPAPGRRVLHRRVADVLLTAADGVPDPDVVAFHLGRAGDPREVEWLVRAGERALLRHAPQAAHDSLTRALDLSAHRGVAPPLGLHRARGLARETLGDFAGALADHEAARAAARAAGDGRGEWRARLDLGQLWAARDYARVGEHYAHALALARGFDDPVALAGSLNRLGNWLVNTGQPWEGVGYHREALTLLETRGDPQGLAETLDVLGMAEWIGTGEATAAVRDFGRAIDLLRTLDLPKQLSSCLASRCGAGGRGLFEPVGTIMRPPEANLRDAEEALRLAEAADWPAGQVYAMLQAGHALSPSGEFGRSLDYLERAFDMATAIDHRQWLAGIRCLLGHLYVLLLAPGPALAHLDAARALARELGSLWWGFFAATYTALARLQANDLAGAEAILETALALDTLADMGPRTLQERRLVWAWAEVRLAQGRCDEALAIADGLVATAPGTGPIPALLTVRGAALLALGRLDEAGAALDDAVRGATMRHERSRLWQAHAARAAVYHAQGHLIEAARATDAARAVVEELAAAVPEGKLREGFRRGAAALLPTDGPSDASKNPPPPAYPAGLSAREAEVLGLVAQGLTNAEIAERLFLSPRTVEQHLRNVYNKLGTSSRTAATRFAIEHGLA